MQKAWQEYAKATRCCSYYIKWGASRGKASQPLSGKPEALGLSYRAGLGQLYRIHDDVLILELLETGTHSDLFKEAEREYSIKGENHLSID